MSEYIGSRISLVSKSEIRYEGTLVKIDSETATVSLQDVQCHGTEGRKGNGNEEIPGSDSVYDGIVFRGSDVKDLTIVAPPKDNRPPPQQMPNDPAILSQPDSVLQHQQTPQIENQNQFRGPQPPYSQQQQQQFGYPGPPPSQFQQHSRFQGPGGAHGFPGQPGAVPGYGGMGYGPPPPPPGYGMSMGYGPPPGHNFPPGPFPPQQQPIGPPGQQMGPPPNSQQQRVPQQMPGQHQQAPIGSKQNTPQPANSQAPAPPQQNAYAEVSEMSTTPAPSSGKTAAGPPPPIDSKPSTSAASAPPKSNQAAQPAVPKPPNKINDRVAVPLAMGSPAAKQQPKPVVPLKTQQVTQTSAPALQPHQTQASATDAATAAVAAAMAKLGATNRPSSGAENLTQKVSQMRVDEGQTRGRGRGRGGPAPRGGRRESGQKHVEVPKEDFDFETANAKFNKVELAKEAIASGSPLGSPTKDTFPSTANGQADDEDVVIPAKPTNEKGYDKKSSFFDNISSELKDRTEQQQTSEYVDGRAMRREERSKNMETFGQGSVDGGFRGRGRGRGRGFGGRGRGYYGGGRGGSEGGDRGSFRGRGGRGQGAEASV